MSEHIGQTRRGWAGPGEEHSALGVEGIGKSINKGMTERVKDRVEGPWIERPVRVRQPRPTQGIRGDIVNAGDMYGSKMNPVVCTPLPEHNNEATKSPGFHSSLSIHVKDCGNIVAHDRNSMTGENGKERLQASGHSQQL